MPKFTVQNHNFDLVDQEVLRNGLLTLPFWQRQILVCRFWHNYTIDEIATSFEMKWEEVNNAIEGAFALLKSFCINDEKFSLTVNLSYYNPDYIEPDYDDDDECEDYEDYVDWEDYEECI